MSQRASNGVRVKDVFCVKGHVYEIPLEAYQRAGVAKHETDYVTDAQIEQASNIYDSMSVLGDIDTQWGHLQDGVRAYK